MQCRHGQTFGTACIFDETNNTEKFSLPNEKDGLFVFFSQDGHTFINTMVFGRTSTARKRHRITVLVLTSIVFIALRYSASRVAGEGSMQTQWFWDESCLRHRLTDTHHLI